MEFMRGQRTGAFAGQDSIVRICHISDFRILFGFEGNTQRIREVMFSHNQNYIITTGDDCVVRVFNLHAQCMEMEFEGNRNLEYSIDISDDDKYICTVGEDNMIYIIDLFNQKSIILKQFFDAAYKIQKLNSIEVDDMSESQI